MKNLIRTIILTLSFTGTSALAAQFEIYVSHPANQDAARSEFATLIQKSIYVDTTHKTIRIPVTPACHAKQLCSESIHWATYKLTAARYVNRSPSHLVAILDSSQIEINVTPDHSTLIQIHNSKGSTQAQFIGGAAQPSRFFN